MRFRASDSELSFALMTFRATDIIPDGAPPHWALAVRHWLEETFPGRWMGRGSPHLPWPPNSPDLTPCDFFLWGHLKSRVYRTQPEDLDELRERLQHEFAMLPQEMVNRAIRSYEARLQRCIEVGGENVE